MCQGERGENQRPVGGAWAAKTMHPHVSGPSRGDGADGKGAQVVSETLLDDEANERSSAEIGTREDQ